MKLVHAARESGVQIPAPYARTIKVLFAPDKEGVEELTFSHAILPPGGRTGYHTHDRPELIYVVCGSGITEFLTHPSIWPALSCCCSLPRCPARRKTAWNAILARQGRPKPPVHLL